MSKKYLQSKSGSLEDLAMKIASKETDFKIEKKVKLETPKTYLGMKENSITAVAAKVVSEGLDPVNKDAVKKDFKNRKDKDIDNDGDVDSTDKYLHTRRQAISKATKSETHTFTAQPMNKKRREAPGEKEVINPIKEGRMKEIAIDVKELSADDFKKKYGETKAEMQKKLGKLEKVDEPYAVGMAQAMKSTGDKPPLKKSTITKAHDIAKGIMKKEQDEKKTKTEKKTYSNLRAEVENGKKTMTGQKPAVIDTEPKTKHI